VYCDVAVGDRVHPFRSSEERVSAALIEARDLAALDARLTHVQRRLHISTRNDIDAIASGRAVAV
jgi:hypothetical protein